MAVVSRLELNHPALGTAGGAGLHASVEALYQKIGDAMDSRWFSLADFDQAEVVDLQHNFDTDIENLRWDLYNYVGGQWVLLTNASSPLRSAFTVIEKVGFEDTTLQITNNTGGDNLTFAVVLSNDPIHLSSGDVKDVDVSTTPPQDGQALVFDSVSSKFKPGASGDSSFKLQAVTTPTLSLKGGYLFIDDERELATYSGSGATSASYGVDLTLNLTTILGSSPAVAPTNSYYLYIDLQTLGTAVTQTDTGRKVYDVVLANFVLSLLTPEVRDPRRYVPLGVIKAADAGNVWSGTGSSFKTLAFRRHETLTRFFAYPETFVDESIVTAVASTTLNHNLSGEPHAIYLTYDDATTEIGLDLSSHLLDVTATQIKIASLGLTLSGTQKLRVRAVRFPQQPALASLSRTFNSAWFQNTATTTVPHGLNDLSDIVGYEVQEWNTTTGKVRNIDRSALVVNVDATNFTLNWTGLTPSATLQYRVVCGGSPIPYAIPTQFGGYTKFVGIGPGSFATVTAALAAAASGDRILILRDTSEVGTLTVPAGVALFQMPGTTVVITGTFGVVFSGVKGKWEGMNVRLLPAATLARGVSVEAADCWVTGWVELNTAQTVTDMVHVTAGGVRAYAQLGIKRTLGTITNMETNLDGAGKTDVWGG